MSVGPVDCGINEELLGNGEAPYIIEQPVDVTVARHQPATLNCRAGGHPSPTIRWFKGGTPVVSDTHRTLLPVGGLFFLRATHGRAHSDAGVYWCEATNQYGTARSRNATLHVAGISLFCNRFHYTYFSIQARYIPINIINILLVLLYIKIITLCFLKSITCKKIF